MYKFLKTLQPFAEQIGVPEKISMSDWGRRNSVTITGKLSNGDSYEIELTITPRESTDAETV